MTTRLNQLLEHVLDGEPVIGDEIDEIFRRADRMRRRRLQALIGSGAAVVAVIAATGYALTVTLMPGADTSAPAPAASYAAARPSAVADPVLALIAPIADAKLRISPRPPERGSGWRQYSVTDSAGRPRGTIEVAVYHVAEDLCFPVLAAPGKCARTEWAPAGVEYVRYDDEKDPDWQVHQTIARHITDGRTVAVMATGERGADDAAGGKPGLTGAQVQKIATDRRLFDAFGSSEDCFGPSSGACPAFKVPVPDGSD
ncbi:hypothetical protein [Paractinoplanes globisporus]|uniref:Uncharacterized protein n=1 Tax=Paractinoplanes globisporus TaxID=113565 RepID=A0ABW6WI57_9ACTN|nr:hypothetical protein [Actinoplanes globisporus]